MNIPDGIVQDGEQILGRMVNGEFIPLAPVPQAAEFDSLVDDVCTSIEHMFKNHLDPEYRFCQEQHSSFLMTGHHRALIGYTHEHGGVESWIRLGTLRSTSESNLVLSNFLDAKERAVRMGKLKPDWLTTRYDFQLLGSKFGLPAPPTPEEVERQRREDRARYDEQRRRDSEAEREMQRKHREAEEAEAALRPEAITVVREIDKHEWTDEWGDDKPFIWEYRDDAPPDSSDDYIRDRIKVVVKLMMLTTPTVPGDEIVLFFKENLRPPEDREEETDEFVRVARLFTQEFVKAQTEARTTSLQGEANDGTISEENYQRVQ